MLALFRRPIAGRNGGPTGIADNDRTRYVSDVPKRSKLLWWVFGVVASAAAACTVVLYWLLRRSRPSAGTPAPSTSDGVVTQPGGGPPVAPPNGGTDDGCQVSCDDSCGPAAGGVCDDAFNDVCQQPLDDVCGGTADSCTSGSESCNSGSSSCDTGSSGCDTGTSNCASTVAGSQLLQLLTGAQPWMSMAASRPRDRVTLPARIGVSVIRAYQRHVSRRLGTRCRFTPSCSEYGVDALRRYGALDGAMLTIARIRRCTVTVPFGTLDPA